MRANSLRRLREAHPITVLDMVFTGDRATVAKVRGAMNKLLNLDDAQRQRLLQIADRCPVHRTLQSDLRIVTELAAED